MAADRWPSRLQWQGWCASAGALQMSHSTSVAGLARAAGVPYQSFNNFVKAGGAWGGRDNQSYHPAAALVEKVRIALGKPKSAKRKALAEKESEKKDS